MALQTKIEVNGIDVSSYLLSYEIEEAWGDAINVCEIELIKTVSAALAITNGQTVEIWRGWTTPTDEKKFSGYIESFDPDSGKIKITAKDKLWDLVRKELTHTYDSGIDPSAGKISAIFTDLVTTYGLLTADATTVQDSGTTVLMNRFVCNHASIFERCKKLADVLGWQIYYRADTNKVYFEQQGFTSNSTILTVGSNILGIPKWTYDITEMCNDVTIVGAYQEIETTESGQIGVTAGYTTSSITLGFTPISVKVYGDANNPPTTLRAGGLPDSSTTYFYYVDKPNKKVLPATGTSFTGNHFFETRYSHAVPIPVHMYSQASMDLYGQFRKTITFTDIRTVADAEERGSNWLVKYSSPFIYTTLKVRSASTNSFRVGQAIRVIDGISTPNIDKTLVITRCQLRWPGDYDELTVGDKTFRLAAWMASMAEGQKRQAESEFDNQDIITELVTDDNTQANAQTFQPRYRKITTQTASGVNLFILGNASYGVLGTNELGDAGLSAEANSFVQQFENVYEEEFLDEDFKGSATATWSTAGTLTFTGAQNAISTSIDYNNGTITTGKITVTASSGAGNLTISLSADGGSHWETATSGTAHAFTNTGTDLRWKIVSSNNAVVTNIRIEDYH